MIQSCIICLNQGPIGFSEPKGMDARSYSETLYPKTQRPRFELWVRTLPWRREWLSTPVFLPGEGHEERSLAGYSPQGHKESDTTEQLSMHKAQKSSEPFFTLHRLRHSQRCSRKEQILGAFFKSTHNGNKTNETSESQESNKNLSLGKELRVSSMTQQVNKVKSLSHV